MANQSYFTSRGLSESAIDAEALLNRYPDISEQELATLIRTLAELPLLNFGLLAANESLGPKLDQFYADHGAKLRPPVTRWAIAVPVAIVAVALAYLAVS